MMSKGHGSGEESRPTELADSGVVLGLLSCLAVISDPRKRRGKRHLLLDILAIAVLGCLCGCDDAEALEDWAKKERRWLSGFLKLPRGTPGQDVFLRVLAAIDPEQFRSAFLVWVREILHALGVEGQIAVDGQTNRGSRDRAHQRGPVHLVSALACEQGLVLGQVKTDDKSNEITAIPQLLRLLDLRGAMVSMDAMGCQVSIAKLIRSQQGDYLMGLKGNQSTLQDETEALFAAAQAPRSANVDEQQPPAIQQVTENDKGHGRLEKRTAKVISDFGDWVPSAERWPDIKGLIAIDSTREDLQSGKSTTETRFYITSRQISAQEAMATVRRHWLVENQLHWCLDVSFGQDANQTRSKHAAENLAVVRHFALNLARSYSGDRYSVPRRRRLCDYNVEYRETILGASSSASR
jgi:predicted transposase YbfD/YdcC